MRYNNSIRNTATEGVGEMKKMATEKQIAFIEKLQGERRVSSETQELIDYVDAMGGRMSCRQASTIIDSLLRDPKKSAPKLDIGDKVRTRKFGVGTVKAIDGPVVTVETARGEENFHISYLRAA